MGGEGEHERDRRGSKEDGKKCVHDGYPFSVWWAQEALRVAERVKSLTWPKVVLDRGFVPLESGESNAAGTAHERGRRSRTPAGLAGSLPMFCGD
jgi:hypothetical protein